MENNNIQHTSTALGWLEKVLEMAKRYTFLNWLEAFLVIFISATMVICFANPEKVLNFFIQASQEQHTEMLEMRQKNNTEVQDCIDNFLYRMDASRIVVTELHNGQNSVSGIPFLKATATFESIADGVLPVASQYQNANLSLYPFANYLYTKGFWSGQTEDMRDIDKPLMYRMLSNSTTHFSACTIEGEKKTIGFIFVSYDGERDLTELKQEMQKLSVRLGVLLELRNR